MKQDNCCGYPQLAEQQATLNNHIAYAKDALDWRTLREVAKDAPQLVHNISVSPLVTAIEDKAQAMRPMAHGWMVDYCGRLRPRTSTEGASVVLKKAATSPKEK